VNNMGLRLVKVRVAQDRRPELGDKFSNRHGQKGTINVMYRAQDMPRTADGITPDMIMNPTAIPSRMTIGQMLEMIMGNAAANIGAIGNCTAFMNDGSPHEALGNILESLGMNRLCNQVLYNGATGEQIQADIFMGVVYAMRLKHMTEDKWNARGEGRKEQRTHQPTGGRGNEGGLKIGELERDAICAHGVSSFLQESFMKRSDGTNFYVCNGCGTIPIYNERQDLFICNMCDGPLQYSGDNAANLEPIPPPTRTTATFSQIQMPYATKLLMQELDTFLNMGLRVLTTRDVTRLRGLDTVREMVEVDAAKASQPIPVIQQREETVPEVVQPAKAPTVEDVNRELANAEEAARATQAAVTVSPEAAAAVGTTPTNAAVAQLAGDATPVAAAQPAAVGEAQEQEVELAEGSFTPAAPQPVAAVPPPVAAPPPLAPQPAVVQQGGALVAENTTEGAPLITIDTSDSAMAAAGLKTPSDATGQVAPPFQPPAYYPPQQGGYSSYSPRRPRIQRQHQQYMMQEGGGGYQDQQQQQQQEPPKQQYSGPVIKVEKLG
jgi:hypothetical protein